MAFWRCNNLISVTAEMTNPCSITSSTFPDQLKSVGVLYVPAGRKSLYIYQGWDRCFANIEEMDEKPLWLSIVDAEQGTTKLQCKFGGIYTLCFEPADGWQIHSVTWQGQDVTAQLTADGVFTTPAISADAELNVTYQKGINGIKSTAQTSPFRVNAHRGILSISGTSPGTPIAVYDLGGRLITTAKAADGITTLNMPTSESVVIVKAGEQSVKVAR